ncbi:MAG: hypothetical protein IRZ08_07745 [Frankia sp.]|nr:hypothetical protein [Frankia sp.]
MTGRVHPPAPWRPSRPLVSLASLGSLLLATLLLAGCGDDREGEDPRAAAESGVIAGAPPTRPAPATPSTPGTGPDAGSGGSASPGAGATATEDGGGGGATEPGAEAGDPATGAGDVPEVQVPQIAPSPVFVGEACYPGLDAEGRAVNGLVLYCVPPTAGPEGTAGRWSVTPPQQLQVRPQPGTDCDAEDVGVIRTDPNGRPVSCLRDPGGELRWTDVS